MSEQGASMERAIALYRGGAFKEARGLCLTVLQTEPDHLQALGLLGLAAGRCGLEQEAITAYQQVLRQQDDLAAAVNLGNLFLNAGRLGEALEIQARAHRMAPHEPLVLINIGVTFGRLGRHNDAVRVCQQALALDPCRTDALYNMVMSLHALDRVRDSLPWIVRHLRLTPQESGIWNLLGLAYQRLGMFDKALGAYRKVLVLDPAYEDALNNTAALLYQQNQPRAAALAYRRTLAARPDSFMGSNNLALALNRVGEASGAVAALRRAVALRPDAPEAWLNLGNTLKDMGTLDEAVLALCHAARLAPDNPETDSNLLFLSNNLSSMTRQALYDAHRTWAKRFADPLMPACPAERADPSNRRMRVGYVSPDLWTHSVAFFFEPLLAHHDTERFEVFVYADVRAPDATTQRLQGLTEHWRATYGLSQEEFCQLVRHDGIDILVDLAGHTAENRQMAFARKPAPVQATWLGYPNTTGQRAMDWRITDAVADPTPSAEACHSERLMRLAGGFLCYRPLTEAPDVVPPPCGQENPITFGSFNALAKMDKAVVKAWARIVKEVPHSRLFLKARSFGDEAVQARFRTAFAVEGVSSDRLILAGHTGPQADHLGLYGRIDIGLDPFPYNGTTTTCEALWMGVPVVTLAGETHAGRVGASLLLRLGLRELVAEDLDGYVAMAVALAGDRDRLVTLRSSMRERMRSSSLLDAPGFTRRFEAALEEMVFLGPQA